MVSEDRLSVNFKMRHSAHLRRRPPHLVFFELTTPL